MSSETKWSDNRIVSEMKVAARYNKDAYGAAYVSITVSACASVAQTIRNEMQERIAELGQELAELRKRGHWPVPKTQGGALSLLIDEANAPGEDEAWGHLQEGATNE